MLKVVRLIVEEEVQKVQTAEKEKLTEIAKRLLKRGLSLDAIMEDTELDEATIRSLQS